MKRTLRILALMVLFFVFGTVSLAVLPRLSFGGGSKNQTISSAHNPVIEKALKEGAMMVTCENGKCYEVRSGELVGESKTNGSFLVFPDNKANRAKAEILGEHVKFVTKDKQ